MEGSDESTNDHLFEDDLIRMCIEQLLDDEDERDTTDEMFKQQSKKMHFTAPSYQVIGQQPLKHGVIGSKAGFPTGINGKHQRNSVSFSSHFYIVMFVYTCEDFLSHENIQKFIKIIPSSCIYSFSLNIKSHQNK